MKYLKHLCHSNKKSYLICWQNQTMKKRILQLTGARREYLYTRIKSHLLPQHNFQKVIRHKHSPLGVLKFSFHTDIFVNTEETLSDAQFKLISTVITWVPSRSFQSFTGVLAKIPSRIMSFSAEKQKAKQQQHIDINHSDLTDRTGHWIENPRSVWNT